MREQRKTFFFSLVAVFAITACSFSKDGPNKSASEKEILIKDYPTDETSLIESDFGSSVVSPSEEAINQYSARISWKIGKESRIKIYLNGDREKPLAILNSSQKKNFFDYPCVAGDVVIFSVDAFSYHSSNPTTENKIFEIHCPIDVEVSGAQVFDPSSYQKIGKIFFHKNSILLLQGRTLEAHIDRLIVDQFARIETYSKTTSLRNSSYMPVPYINLEVDEVSVLPRTAPFGKLEIVLRGLNGKDGQDIDVESEKYQRYLKEKALDRKGSKGRMAESKISFPKLECVTQAGNGEDGKNGFPGIDGENGADGMISPALNLIFNKTSNLFVDVTKIPGRRGHGSQGLPAIQPGKGGEPGDNVPACNDKASYGNEGKPALDGLNGLDGRDGEEGDSFINEKVNSQVRTENP